MVDKSGTIIWHVKVEVWPGAPRGKIEMQNILSEEKKEKTGSLRYQMDMYNQPPAKSDAYGKGGIK